jgi:hypothetical protein
MYIIGTVDWDELHQVRELDSRAVSPCHQGLLCSVVPRRLGCFGGREQVVLAAAVSAHPEAVA